MQRGLAVLALSALAGVLAGPLASLGVAASTTLAALSPRSSWYLGVTSAVASALALVGGLGRPGLWASLGALAALSAMAAPALHALAPRHPAPPSAPAKRDAVSDIELAIAVLALSALGLGMATLATALHPTAGAGALAATLAALVLALGRAADQGWAESPPLLLGALAAGLVGGLPLLAVAWPALAPLGDGSSGPALVTAASRRLALLSPGDAVGAAPLILTALARALDVAPVWLLLPLTAALAASATLALWLLASSLWPGEAHRATLATVLALILPWTSPLALGLRGDTGALLVVAAGLAVATCAVAARRGRANNRWCFAAASLGCAALAPPLALGVLTLAHWALPRTWAWGIGGLAAALAIPAWVVAGSGVTLTAVVPLAGVGTLALALGPGMEALAGRQRVLAAGGLGVLGVVGWLVSGPPHVAAVRPAELLLLEQIAQTHHHGPLGYVGDAAGARWADALLSACACGPLQPTTWEAWRQGDAPPDVLVATAPQDRRADVLVLGWYDGSALVRRPPVRYATVQTLGPQAAVFGDELILRDWALPTRARPGDDLTVRFTAQAQAGGSFAIHLALRDREGTSVAETVYHLALASGERQPQHWQTTLPYNAATGAYELSVTVTSDGALLPANTPSGHYVPGTMAVARVDDVLPPETQPPGTPVGAAFGERIELLSYQMPPGPFPAGSSFPLTLYWRALEPGREDLSVFVHLVAADGRIVAQADGYPVGGRYPTGLWQAGDVVRDERRLAVPADAAGTYELRVGWYHYDTGLRLRLSGSASAALRLASIEVAR